MSQKAKILVVGDVILDVYLNGSSNRLSPEAPVPVVHIKSSDYRLGGAANVAINVASLGWDVSLMGIVGQDKEADFIAEKLIKNKINNLLVKSTRPTIKKTRVLAQNQQIVRIDVEETCEEKALYLLRDRFFEEIFNFDLVVFSDYNKGVLTFVSEFIEEANLLNKMTLVDPKGSDFLKYQGASCITPNKSELRQIIGTWKDENTLEKRARSLMKKLELKALLLTRSEEGMTLFEQERTINIKAQAKEVFDVSGAGDTVIAVLACLLSEGHSWEESAITANQAAAVVVGRLGTSVITPSDILL